MGGWTLVQIVKQSCTVDRGHWYCKSGFRLLAPERYLGNFAEGQPLTLGV